MKRKLSRRQFLVQTAAATAAVYASEPLALYGERLPQDALQSTLLPDHSGPLFNVARNRAVYQSSSVNDDHTAHLVTDGSTRTYWECEPGGEQWISVDLGVAMQVHRLTVRWGSSWTRDYRIQVSGEGPRQPASWTTVHSATQGQGGVEEILLKHIRARQIRLIGVAADRGFSIAELEAWGPEPLHSAPAPPQVVATSGARLTKGWMLQSAMFTLSGPDSISSPRHFAKDWLPATVPGTVLTSYLEDDAIPDPFYGNQQSQVSEEFFTRNDFWYRNTFVISSDCRGRRLWLVLDGINWKADVYLNGSKLGQIDGAFIRARFDITRFAVCGGTNCVAVLIHQVAHPGPVQHKQLGAQYRNGGILGMDSPTFLASIGWNWLPTIRGRNIGIWNHVRFETSQDVVLRDPWVSTKLPASDNSRAELTVKTELVNLSNELRRCTLSLSMEKIFFRKEFALQPGETQVVTIDKADCAALSIENPRLWWPNGYGEPTLHTMRLQIESDDAISDEKSVRFGIRKIDYRTEDGILNIFVNHCRILCQGGNWGMDNGMLMCDEQGYDLRLRMHRDMHLVMIRNWVGMVGREEFYDACDRYGLLVWDDFWLANPSDGPDPSDHAMFMKNAMDKVRRVRHHPSLALYCGRNEGVPPPDLDAGMRDAIANLDGTRYYISNSAAGLVTGHGPYDNQDPAWYFEHRGSTFHSEQGIVCVPPVESMRAMMPERSLWPISDMWAIHDYQDPRSVLYTQRIERRYGEPAGIEDYCRKAQMVNLETAKAIYESLRSRQGSGMLIWMTQAAWPALICQLYDYSFEQTAAYFGAKTACQPLHIFWDQSSNAIKVANNTAGPRSGLRAEASIYSLDAHRQWHKTADVNVPATTAQTCFPLEVPHGLSNTFFIKLKLKHGAEILSDNFYWSASPTGDCLGLNTLPRVGLSVSGSLKNDPHDCSIRARVLNPTDSIALAIRLKVIHGPAGERVLPAMYEDNYFSLLPHESKTVRIGLPNPAAGEESPRLSVEGWNIREKEVSLL